MDQNLYQDIVMKHSRSPQNYGKPESYDRHAKGRNRLCGDEVEIYLSFDEAGKTIQSSQFSGESCAICKASASMLTQAMSGRPIESAEDFLDQLSIFAKTWEANNLGEFEAFSLIKAYPTRLKCLRLPWETFREALGQEQAQTVTTESDEETKT